MYKLSTRQKENINALKSIFKYMITGILLSFVLISVLVSFYSLF